MFKMLYVKLKTIFLGGKRSLKILFPTVILTDEQTEKESDHSIFYNFKNPSYFSRTQSDLYKLHCESVRYQGLN